MNSHAGERRRGAGAEARRREGRGGERGAAPRRTRVRVPPSVDAGRGDVGEASVHEDVGVPALARLEDGVVGRVGGEVKRHHPSVGLELGERPAEADPEGLCGGASGGARREPVRTREPAERAEERCRSARRGAARRTVGGVREQVVARGEAYDAGGDEPEGDAVLVPAAGRERGRGEVERERLEQDRVVPGAAEVQQRRRPSVHSKRRISGAAIGRQERQQSRE